MGSLIHIAEIAALIFVAYLVGWLVGYGLRRISARPARPIVVTTAPQPAPVVAEADDALVKAPVVVPVAASAPAHVQAKVTQIEPATAVAVPDGMVLAEAKSIDVPKAAPAPVNALESLKSLTTAIPLTPIELRPIVGPEPAYVQPVAAAPVIAPIVVEAVPEPVVTAAVVSEPQPLPTIVAEPVTVDTPVAYLKPSPEPAAEASLAAAELAPEPTSSPSEPEPALPEVPPAPEPEPAPMAMPSSRPGVAWSGAIKGREAAAFERVAEADAEPEGQGASSSPAGLDVSLLESLADELDVDEPALPIAELSAMAAATESNARPISEAPATEPLPAGPVEPAASADAFAESPVPASEADAEIAAPSAEPAAAIPEPAAVPPAPPRQFDEDAAMRAIEGGWSRRQTRAMSDAYELTDVSAAVSAAQIAVEQVLAAKGIDASEQGARAQASFGKPKGLPHPRNHQRDNLKQINGLGPLDESSLNNLGIYHFDQIAGWDQKEVLWLENHAFARGRIGREDWQGQARSLMVDSEAARRIGG